MKKSIENYIDTVPHFAKAAFVTSTISSLSLTAIILMYYFAPGLIAAVWVLWLLTGAVYLLVKKSELDPKFKYYGVGSTETADEPNTFDPLENDTEYNTAGPMVKYNKELSDEEEVQEF